MASKRKVPVFIINGLLEGGKTTFIKKALLHDPAMEKERVLVIVCEEGEEEYEDLPDSIHLHVVEEKEELTSQLLQELHKKYKPTCVVVEYNGVWGMQHIYMLELPSTWGWAEQITVISGPTFKTYFANMKSIFADMIRLSTSVFVKQCTRQDDFKFYRDSIKGVAPRTELLFISDTEGPIDISFEEDLPYDLKADVIRLDEETYPVWYIDAMDHMERYEGKTVEFTGQVLRPPECRKDTFFCGNMIMTCCEDDMQFWGYLCKHDSAPTLQEGSTVKIRAQVISEMAPEYDEVGPVLYVKKMTAVLAKK